LERACTNCANVLGDDDRFCPRCGADQESAELPASAAPAATAPAASAPVAAERRLVSVLFADLVGFTTYSEGRDPEEVRAMLTEYFDRSRAIIEQFGGTVDKFIGDAVMAVWGATTSREDDAELAVRAALDLVDMVSGLGESADAADLALRAGVLSGESSVGPGGNAMGLVVGDMVNTASRLQSIAEPGTVLVGDSTVDLTRLSINYESAGVHEVKGKAEPVAAWRATGLAAGIGGKERSDLIEPPFTGRDHELRMLKDQFGASKAEDRARLVSIIGEAGIGKTRLAWELKKHVDGLVDTTYWHEGRSPSYGDGLTFWALGEMIRFRAGIAESDDDHKARTKLRTAVVEYVEDPEEQRWIEPRLAGLLGLDELPSDARHEFFAALRAFFQRIADRSPVVMVFEDLHWGDDGLLDFIEELVDRSPRSPIFVLTLSRPELLERRTGFGSQRRNHLSAHLSPLADTSMAQLIKGVVPDMPEDLLTGIVERAAGIPLYAVEFIRMYLADDGSSDVTIPDSLRAVIGARIDRLDPSIRAVLQDAAVLGVSFTGSTLAALRGESVADVQGALDVLRRQEILEVDDDPRSPERGQYVFVQGLIREVAYARLGRDERRQRHLNAARQLEIGGDPEVAAAIAAHYLAAHEAGSDSGEELVLARRALTDAARRAAGLHSHHQVVAMAERALEIPAAGSDAFDLHMLATSSATTLFDVPTAQRHGTAAIELARAEGDGEREASAIAELGRAFNENSEPDKAIALMGPAYEAISKLESPAQVTLAAEYARSFIFSGDFEAIGPVVERVLIAAERLRLYDVIANAFATKAAALGYTGRILEAIALAEAAMDVAEKHDFPAIVARAVNNLAVELAGESYERRLEVLERGLVFAERSGETDYLLRLHNLLIDTYVQFGRFDDAFALIDSIDIEALPDAWQLLLSWTVHTARQLREGGGDAEVLLDILDRIGEIDGQMAALIPEMKVPVLYIHGRFAEAVDRAVEARHVAPEAEGLASAVHSCVALQDADRLRLIVDKLAETHSAGTAVLAVRMYADAALAALDGDPSAHRFVEALNIAHKSSSPLARAAMQAGFSALIPDDPDARRAGEEALAFVERSGAEQLQRLWAAGLPGGEQITEAAG
jgi:class 3 adenylate cyclase/tetratricopeptide (TPR) repeat protein